MITLAYFAKSARVSTRFNENLLVYLNILLTANKGLLLQFY